MKERNYFVPVLKQRGGKGVHKNSTPRHQEKLNINKYIEEELLEEDDYNDEEWIWYQQNKKDN